MSVIDPHMRIRIAILDNHGIVQYRAPTNAEVLAHPAVQAELARVMGERDEALQTVKQSAIDACDAWRAVEEARADLAAANERIAALDAERDELTAWRERSWVCPCCREGRTDDETCTMGAKSGAAIIADAKMRGIAKGYMLVHYDLMIMARDGSLAHSKRELLLELAHRYYYEANNTTTPDEDTP